MLSKVLVVGIVAVAGLAVAAVSLGAIPGSSGTISACYAKSNGGLRVIDAESGATCVANKETALSWNQQGPPGQPGQPGPPGPPGPAATQLVLATSSAIQESADGFDTKFAHAACPTGEVATGGGYNLGATRAIMAQITVTTTAPSSSDTPGELDGWSAFAIAPTGVGSWSISAYAVCTGNA